MTTHVCLRIIPKLGKLALAENLALAHNKALHDRRGSDHRLYSNRKLKIYADPSVESVESRVVLGHESWRLRRNLGHIGFFDSLQGTFQTTKIV